MHTCILIGKDNSFPEELMSSGLSESVLMSIYEHVKCKQIGEPCYKVTQTLAFTITCTDS